MQVTSEGSIAVALDRILIKMLISDLNNERSSDPTHDFALKNMSCFYVGAF